MTFRSALDRNRIRSASEQGWKQAEQALESDASVHVDDDDESMGGLNLLALSFLIVICLVPCKVSKMRDFGCGGEEQERELLDLEGPNYGFAEKDD